MSRVSVTSERRMNLHCLVTRVELKEARAQSGMVQGSPHRPHPHCQKYHSPMVTCLLPGSVVQATNRWHLRGFQLREGHPNSCPSSQ